MKDNFEKIYSKAQLIYSINKDMQTVADKENKTKQEMAEKDIEQKRKSGYMDDDYEKNCCSDELLSLIKSHNFHIDSYEKYSNIDENDYYPVLETYYCSYNNWLFKIKNHSDPDIREGIFHLGNLKNKITNEIVDNYCDLGCRNTSQYRLDLMLGLLEYEKMEDYVNKIYKIYIELPNCLSKKGYNIEKVNYNFKLDDNKLFLKVYENVYIEVYNGHNSEMNMCITNKDEDVEQSFEYRNEDYQYSFEYRNEKDINELCKCIEAFKDSIEGRIGYFENGEYHKNNEISGFYDKLGENSPIFEEYKNYRKIQITSSFDDPYGYMKYVEQNKYKGIEIYDSTDITFNDAAQWTIGEYSNKSIITFEYNKNLCKDKCILSIDNYVYRDNDVLVQERDYEDNQYSCELDRTKLVDSIKIYGAFTELFKVLKEYVYTMSEIHGITDIRN